MPGNVTRFRSILNSFMISVIPERVVKFELESGDTSVGRQIHIVI